LRAQIGIATNAKLQVMPNLCGSSAEVRLNSQMLRSQTRRNSSGQTSAFAELQPIASLEAVWLSRAIWHYTETA